MKKLLLTALVAVSPLCATLTVADQPADSDTSHPGAYVKDSVITTKIKTKLAAEKPSTLAHVHVDTDANGMVVLSGTARNQERIDRAVAIARETEGVASVQSRIRIKKDD